MSAGEDIDKAHAAAARAAGALSMMIEKRRIRREGLQTALGLLEESAALINGVLTAYSGGGRVGALTPENSGENHGTSDTRG